jgi:dihydrofolate reductase
MRKLKIIEHISLDGVIQHSADNDDFPYGDWTAPYRTPAGLKAILAAQGKRFDLLLGGRTYDRWSGFWPKAPSSAMADSLNAATKYVVTHRLESLQWGPFKGLGPNIAQDVRRVKSQDGPDLSLWVSSMLTSTLLDHGLMDEVILAVYPVLLGTGKRFFAEGTPACSFELIHSKATPSGIILNTYKVAGPLKSDSLDDYPVGKKGQVLTVEFSVLGIPCLGLNGGLEFPHSEAFSFQIATKDQKETDRYWNAIVGNGGVESMCGWCKDRWGLSWQITPRTLTEAMTKGGSEASVPSKR